MYKKIINMTFQSVFENKNTLIKSLLLPLAFFIVLRIVTEEFQNIKESSLIFPNLLINILVAVITHRILLLNEKSVDLWNMPQFNRFLKKTLLFLLICIPFGLLAIIPTVGIILAILSILYISIRLSLVFPSISLDEDITFKQSWEFTKKYQFLLLFSVVLFPMFFAVIVGLVYTLVIEFLSGLISNKLYVLYPILELFIMVFVISALCATYKIIKDEHPEFFKKEKNEDENKITIINNEEKKTFDKNEKMSIDFETLKQELNIQYNSLGFIDVVINKENSWMLKNPKLQNAYIMLSKLTDNEYKIETYNTQEASLRFLEIR